jgi:hypothetical protein
VNDVIGYLLNLTMAARVHEASQAFLSSADDAKLVLVELERTSAELSRLARQELFENDGLGEEWVNINPVLVTEDAISHVEHVRATAGTLAEALSVVARSLEATEVTAPIIRHGSVDVLREVLGILRDGGLDWPEIGALIVDDYETKSPRVRGERFRKLLERTPNAESGDGRKTSP